MLQKKRLSIRLPDYDYSNPGLYFITICTKDRVNYFYEYPILKLIVREQWLDLPRRFRNVVLDEFIIMLDHIHCISRFVGAPFLVAQNRPTISQIIWQYKSLCFYHWLKLIRKNNWP